MASAPLFAETRQVLVSRLSWLALLGAFDPGWTSMRIAARAVVWIIISELLVGGLALWLEPSVRSIIGATLITVLNGSIALLVLAKRHINMPAGLLMACCL